MSTIFRKTATNIKIGELLVQAGMLTQQQLTEAVRHAGGKRLQLGQILVMYGYLRAADLQAALDAQSMIRDRAIELSLALTCLKIAYKTGVTFVEALAEQEGQDLTKTQTGKLGELLMEAGLIATEEFARALQRSLTTNLPLGRMLVLNKVLNDEQLTRALEIQVRLRDEMITRQEAVTALRTLASLERPKTAAEHDEVAARDLKGPRRRGVRLGELMVLGGLITETDVMNALEWGLVNNKPIGEVLVAKELVTQKLIDAALELQKRIDSNKITVVQASECLAKIRSTGCSVDEAFQTLNDDLTKQRVSLSYEKLLTIAKVVSEDDIESAFDISSKSPQVIARVLFLTEFLDDHTMQATLRCHQLLSRGWITQDDALATLHYCLAQKASRPLNFDDALRELGWQENRPLALLDDEDGKVKMTASDLIAAVEAEHEETAAGKPEGKEDKKKRKYVETIQPEDPNARNLAMLVRHQVLSDKAANAEARSKSLAESFSQLAMSYYEQGRLQDAQMLYERILVHRLKKLGPSHQDLIPDLRNLAGVLCAQGKFNQAEAFMRRVVSITDTLSTPDLSDLADSLSILGGIYFYQGKYPDAAEPYARAYQMRRKASPQNQAELVESMMDYAKALKKLNRDRESEQLYEEAKALAAGS